MALASKLWKAINNYVKAVASRTKKAKNNLAVNLCLGSLENRYVDTRDTAMPKGKLSHLPKLTLDRLG